MIDFLVVEDGDVKFSDIQAFIKSIRKNFYIERVCNVTDAIKAITRRQYSFVLIDLQLPNEMNGNEINSSAGVELIRWIKHNQKRRRCKPPENIIVLSQYKDLIDAHHQTIHDTRIFSYLYDSSSDDWKSCLKEYIEEFLLTKEEAVPKINDEVVVYSVHGINTNGEWQGDFGNYISEHAEIKIIHHEYKYQYYPVLSFLIPPLRTNEVNRMVRELEVCASKAPNSTVHLVGHSFGTYVICEALKIIPTESSPKIGNLILVNSVLNSGYEFDCIVKKHKIERVICECAINDKILILSQICALKLGMGGRMGFKGRLYKTIINRYFRGGHSDLFNESMFSDWLRVITNKDIPDVDEREKIRFISSLKNTVLIYSPYLTALLFFVIIYFSV